MQRLENGVPADEIVGVTWTKSGLSNPSGNCVELAALDEGTAVRNSRHPAGPALIYTRQEMDAFLQGVKAGDFDHLLDS